jgi:hypothetical protein
MNVWAFLNELMLGPQLEAFVNTWGFIPARYFALGGLSPEDWVRRFLPSSPRCSCTAAGYT